MNNISVLISLLLFLIINIFSCTYGAINTADNTSPLDIELTKDWEQLISEVWAGISTGRMPPLPEPVILGDNDEDVIDGDADPLEMEALADEENHRRSQAFIEEIKKKTSMDGGDFLKKDGRCKALWEIIEKHIEKEKVNSTFVELGAGTTLYVPAREDPLMKRNSASGESSSTGGWMKKRHKKDNKENKDVLNSITIRGCISLKAALGLKRATVLYTGHSHYPLEDGEDDSNISSDNILIKADRTVQLRNKLQNRPQNHIMCNAPISTETVATLIEEMPELYTYQILTEIRSLAGNMLPHEFERFIGQILSLATRTFLPTPLPDDNYFSYWKNAHDLAIAAAHSVGLDVEIEDLKKKQTSSFNWYNRQNNNKNEHKHSLQPKLDGALLIKLSEWKETSDDNNKDKDKKKKEEDDKKKKKENDDKKKKEDDKKKKKEEDDKKKKENEKKNDKDKKKRRRRLNSNWYVNHFNNHNNNKKDKKDDDRMKKVDNNKNMILKLVPTLLNASDVGISLKSLRLLNIGEFDRSRIFLNLLKTADASIMKANKPSEIQFVRGSLIFAKGSLGKTNVQLGVDSAEREEHPIVKNSIEKEKKREKDVESNDGKDTTQDEVSLNDATIDVHSDGESVADGTIPSISSDSSSDELGEEEEMDDEEEDEQEDDNNINDEDSNSNEEDNNENDDSLNKMEELKNQLFSSMEKVKKIKEDRNSHTIDDNNHDSGKKKYITESESFAKPIKGIRIVEKNTIKRKQKKTVSIVDNTLLPSSAKTKKKKSNLRSYTRKAKAKAKGKKEESLQSENTEATDSSSKKAKATYSSKKIDESYKKLLKAALFEKMDNDESKEDNDASDSSTNDDLKDKDESRTRHRQLLSTSQHTKKANKKSSASPTDILKRWIRRPSLHHRQNNWASKKLQGQLNMVVHENDGFERWWPLFRSNEIESSKGKRRRRVTWSIVVHGENLGLLSTKLALMYPKSTIVSVKDDTNDMNAHLQLLELLGIHNNILCNQRTKSIASADSENKGSHNIIARYGILGMDIFQSIMQYANHLDKFEKMLGSLISVAATTFMELPNWDGLTAAIDTITGNEDAETSISKTFTAKYLDIASNRGSADPWVGLLSAAASQAGLSGVTMRMLSSNRNRKLSSSNSVIEKVKYAIFRRLAKRNIRKKGSKGAGPTGYKKKIQRSGKVNLVRIDVEPWAKKGEETIQRFQHGGVSLAALKKFGIIPKQLAQIFRLFMRLPMHQIEKKEGSSAVIAPWNTYYHGSGGGYRSGFPRVVVSFEKSGASYEAYYVPENEEAEEDAAKLVDPRWSTIENALTKEDVGEDGEFSYLEFNSGSGLLSLSVAEKYPSATVISVESEKVNVAAHLKRIKILGQSQVNNAGKKKNNNEKGEIDAEEEHQLAKVAANNWVCNVDVGLDLLRKLYESPEFIRWQVFGGNLVLDHMYDSNGPDAMKEALGYVMSTGMTTFLSLPSAQALSLGLYMFYHADDDMGTIRRDEDSVDFSLSSHPRPRYMQAEMQIISSMAKVPGSTKLSMQSLPGDVLNMVRVDIVNMTRSVNHHFDYAKDGHQRKYKMHVERNVSSVLYKHGVVDQDDGNRNSLQIVRSNMKEGQHSNRGMVIDVYITRQHDKWHIPYGQLYGITLITILRMGLVDSQRTAAYHRFVNLPLYEDMAPWNIVFQGSRMAYIDYDTKDVTYDRVVPLTYRVLSVLFNYKRTVEDFKRCGPSSHNSYGFPHINSCVGGKIKTDFVRNGGKKCEESNAPVPCGDGSCQSDYISCLKVLSKMERTKRKRAAPKITKSSLLEMWRKKEWTFSNKGVVKKRMRS